MAALVTMKVDTLVDPHELFLVFFIIIIFKKKFSSAELVLFIFSCVNMVYAIMLHTLAHPVIFNKLYFWKINEFSSQINMPHKNSSPSTKIIQQKANVHLLMKSQGPLEVHLNTLTHY